MKTDKMKPEDCKRIRVDLGLKQETFAKLCGVKQSLVSRWEKEGPVLEQNIQKLRVLWDETRDRKRLKTLKRKIEEEVLDTVASLLVFAGRGLGTRGVGAALAVGAVSGIGLFGAGLLALGGAYGTYKLLKTVFEPDEGAS